MHKTLVSRTHLSLVLPIEISTSTPTTTIRPYPSLNPQMSLSSLLSLLSALFLAFTVLSAGQAKLTSRLTPEIHDSQVAQESETRSNESRIPIPPATRRKIHGWVNILCGILLLWPSRRKIGAAAAAVLLSWGLVTRLRNGMSLVPPLTMMGLSAVVWYL